MFSASDLYNLDFKESEAFKAFDPRVYDHISLYSGNPVLNMKDNLALLHLAEKALIFFTRSSDGYKDYLENNHVFISSISKRRMIEEECLPGLDFASPWQAFKMSKTSFRKALCFCCEKIIHLSEKRTGFSDSELLDSTLRDDCFDSLGPFEIGGINYDRHHLLGVFALYKIDRAILAIQEKLPIDVANLIVDAQTALRIADECFQGHTRLLDEEKTNQERQAGAGKERHKALKPQKNKVKEIYYKLYSGDVWPTRAFASKTIWDELNKIYYEIQDQDPTFKLISERTINAYLHEIDPEGKMIGRKRKSKIK